ncbi:MULTISPECIES: hypothetical protein [unclassified Methylobacterium]|uniref:hypothetical protein n=1 Tax=unclassified Methylobacterium TaxID=2615210 RepID=UPI000EE8CCB1|nr:hypothetical protein AwMethylo_07310 [Methylobacterium sp.]
MPAPGLPRSVLSAPEHPARAGAPGSDAWRCFCAGFLGLALVLGLAAVAGIALLDPYGLRAAPGRMPGPLMDGNQRFMYPQVVRSGAYDAAVFGTSTARLLDPRDLDAAFGHRFANLAMNAATPWEQASLARLFLRQGPAKAVLFALDATWCDADADRRRTTFRPFPPWLYEPDPSFGVLRQANWQALTVAGRVLLARLGLEKPRLRADGYGVFTPPEAAYDAARAAAHIHGGGSAVEDAPPAETEAAPQGEAMPALGWLDELLAALPEETLRLVAFMPVHVAAQPVPGSKRAAREADCKARVAAIGRARGAGVVDFRVPSPVTTRDANYWDALHYRLPVAPRIVAALAAARAGGGDDPDGFYRVLARPR